MIRWQGLINCVLNYTLNKRRQTCRCDKRAFAALGAVCNLPPPCNSLYCPSHRAPSMRQTCRCDKRAFAALGAVCSLYCPFSPVSSGVSKELHYLISFPVSKLFSCRKSMISCQSSGAIFSLLASTHKYFLPPEHTTLYR